jgi:hypothetical protein
VCQPLAVVPRHPFRGMRRQFLGMPLQLRQRFERVGAAQLAGVAHKRVADLGAVQRLDLEALSCADPVIEYFDISILMEGRREFLSGPVAFDSSQSGDGPGLQPRDSARLG